MRKLELSDILIPGVELKPIELNPNDPHVIQSIEATRIKQAAILKQKEIDPESLRKIIRI